MPNYIEISDGDNSAIVPISAIVAIVQRDELGCAVTLTHPVPALQTNENNTFFLHTAYDEMLKKMQRASA